MVVTRAGCLLEWLQGDLRLYLTFVKFLNFFFCYLERFLDFLCGPTAELNGTTAGVNIKTEPPNSVLSPPITPPESSMAIDEDCSSFNFEDYLSKATPQQGQSVLSLLQSPIAVKQEENLNVNGTAAPVQSQNTATLQLLNLLQGQKNQQGLQSMHNTSLEQLLREPSILAPASRTPVVTSPQPSLTQQQSVITQQVGNAKAFTFNKPGT